MSGKKTLYQKLYSDTRVLNKAWRSVKQNAKSQSRGVDKETLQQFAESAPYRLRVIRQELRDGTYKFSNLKASRVYKSNSEPRPIQIATIRDRVVMKGIELLIRKPLDEKFDVFNNPISYAYIKKEDVLGYSKDDPLTHKNVRGAIEAVRMHIDDGHAWSLKADILKFFPSVVKKELLEKQIFCNLPDESLNDLILEALNLEVEISDDIKKVFKDADKVFEVGELGLPQGSVLSPLLSNIYLSEFDNFLKQSGYIAVRYVDDFIILTKTKREAEAAYVNVKRELKKLKLAIHKPGAGKKTQLKRSDDITFLGVRIKGNKLYPADSAVKRTLKKLAVLPKYSNLTKNLQAINSISNSWGSTYRFCDNLNETSEELNVALVTAVTKRLFRARVKPVFPLQKRSLKRLGIIKFDDSIGKYKDKDKKI